MAGEGCGGARVGHNGVDGFGVAAGGVNNVYVATSVASMRGVGSSCTYRGSLVVESPARPCIANGRRHDAMSIDSVAAGNVPAGHGMGGLIAL